MTKTTTDAVAGGASPDAARPFDQTSTRRSFAALLGAVGACALAACGENAPEASASEPVDEEFDEVRQALTGAGVLKVADTAANLRTITGGTTLWVAALQGIGAAGDGGGGLYYWSSTATPDDGWSALNSGSANAAGWRRINTRPVVEGVLTTSLGSRVGLRSNETVATVGFNTVGDRGGGSFYFLPGVSAGADGATKINGPNGQWRLRLDNGADLNIRQLGCRDNGTTPCATIINTFWNTWKATYGLNASLVLRVPAIEGGAMGYRLEAALDPPDQLNVTLLGDGKPLIQAFDFLETNTSAVGRSGSIFVCDANVDGIKAASPTAVYPFLHVENIGFLGPGASNTSAAAIDTLYMNFCTTRQVACHGFRFGLRLRGSVINHSHFSPVCIGNDWGMTWGHDTTVDGAGGELTDTEVFGPNFQFNRYAHQIYVASTSKVYGGLIQGNLNGLVLGSSTSSHNLNNLEIAYSHVEGNGDDNASLATALPGGRHVVTYAGGGINNVTLRNFPISGSNPNPNVRAIYVPDGAVMTFTNMTTHGPLNVGQSAYVRVNGSDRVAGFTSFAINPYANVTFAVPGTVGVNGGIMPASYTHDWAQSGDEANYLLTSAVTINAPVNGHYYGCVVHYTLVQGTGAPHAVTWSGFQMDPFNTTGANIPSARTTISFKYTPAGWKQFIPQPAFGWLT